MKTFSIIALAVVFSIGIASIKGCSPDGVSQEEFRNTHNYLNARIDTLSDKLDEVTWIVEGIDSNVIIIGNRQTQMITQIVILEGGIDTLKLGQFLIFDEVSNFNTRKESAINWNSLLENFVKSW